MGEVEREGYLQKLWRSKDQTHVAKIVTGIRRCGKSTLLAQFIRRLKESGVDDGHIAYLNFESGKLDNLRTYRDLNDYARSIIQSSGRTYVFLDEVQRVEEWERSINSLMVDYDVDIYITGSNAHLLSSELSTFLSGRYIEIKMLPLSFSEYVRLHPVASGQTIQSRFQDYVWFGSMPMADPGLNADFLNDYLIGIFNTVLRKDVEGRIKARDTAQVENICRFLMSNIGNTTSVNAIANYTKANNATVRKYLRALEDAFIFYKAYRFDIIGKRILSSTEKYYVSDTGMRNSVLGISKGTDLGRQIENIVYLELIRRGYQVTIGSYRDREIDFIATTRDGVEYYQVTQTMLSEEVYDRETRSLKAIDDNFPKVILSLDEIVVRPADGIKHYNLIKWLLGETE
jgi:predicted AAA+ superfamily ATPase